MRLQLGPIPAVAISSRDAAMEAFTKHDRRLTGRYTVDAVRALGWADLSLLNMPSSDPLVSSAFFSVDVVDMDATRESAHGIREHVENSADLMTKANVSDLFPFLRPLDLQGRRRAAARHLGEIYLIVDGIIERRLAENAAASGGDDGSNHGDFLQVLLDLMSTGKLDRDTVKAIVFEVFVTGGDTITVTVE